MPTHLELQPHRAAGRIARYVRRTPLLRLAEGTSSPPAHLKLESLQITGSFKIRGAANAIAALREAEGFDGSVSVVTCSSGNHGRALAYMAGVLGVSATICVPEWVDPVKLDGMRASGARVVIAGATYDEAEVRAAEIAREGARMIHPFDDLRVIEGQSTVALEILQQMPQVETVLIPLSGGGLAGGMASVLCPAGKRVIAVSAGAANVMLQSLDAGMPVECEEEETLATALAGGIGLDNRWTFDLVRTVGVEHFTVTEDQICGAIGWAYRRGLVVEGGGAVALAACLTGRVDADPETTVAVVSGGNLDPAMLRAVMAKGAGGRESAGA